MKRFDVVCVGEMLWTLEGGWGTNDTMRFKPAGGAIQIAALLGRRGLRTGLVSPIEDAIHNRALVTRLTDSGVDIGGVTFRAPLGKVLMLDATDRSRLLVGMRDDDTLSFELPNDWSARVLLLSGLSPVVSHAGSLCKVARAARRAGAIVVVDVHARWQLWAGRDPRALRSVIREADVVRVSTEDLAVLGLTERELCAMARPEALFVVSAATGQAWMTGPLKELAPIQARTERRQAVGRDTLTAAVCAQLARSGDPAIPSDRCARVLAQLEAHPTHWAGSS